MVFKDFHLVAIIKEENGVELQEISPRRDVYSNLKNVWNQQYDAFLKKDKQEFTASHNLARDECFIIPNHNISEKFAEIDIEHFINVEMDDLFDNVNLIDKMTGIVACVLDENNNPIMLFQRFMQHQIIKPGGWTSITRNVLVGENDDLLIFRNKLTAVYYIKNKTLLVDSIHNAKAFLPSLSDYYIEASDDMIRDTLSHELIECEDREVVVCNANQTIRRQFAIIEEEGYLDLFSAMDIQAVAAEGNTEIQVQNDKIVFPTDYGSIKDVLTVLCDGLVRSLLTKELFEAPVKKKVEERVGV